MQLASFCRHRLNRVTGRSLAVVLLEMQRRDPARTAALPPRTLNRQV